MPSSSKPNPPQTAREREVYGAWASFEWLRGNPTPLMELRQREPRQGELFEPIKKKK
ncbi:hypothetical protein GCM10023183_08720 [Nibribacter koreensis]|uniref:Uncharacterized protein n=1 Tax=Nibribacter koreensis TaxID=1084519 RepID=A0ABP8FB34_9BACT